ncbi:MAG TPA: hypothetical protein PLK94_05085 [Alphaproteobacteria bacterium]|nr:hypothetical protein [Alphaproteobacteria bacterium]HOO50648.1 hypothetical protein [Alphaproteobacteria bacterium]
MSCVRSEYYASRLYDVLDSRDQNLINCRVRQYCLDGAIPQNVRAFVLEAFLSELAMRNEDSARQAALCVYRNPSGSFPSLQ